MRSGETLEIRVSDEDSKVNVALAAKELGVEISRMSRDNEGKWRIIIGKK